MKYTFLGEEIELNEFTIKQADEIQALLLGDSDVTDGEASVNISNFKASQYLAIEYGTKDKKITRDSVQELPASKASDLQELYDEIMKLNGQQ
jgi:hypothetical protein